MLHNIQESENILYFDFLSFSFVFYRAKKGDPLGGGGACGAGKPKGLPFSTGSCHKLVLKIFRLTPTL
jgi:hypothetical protein